MILTNQNPQSRTQFPSRAGHVNRTMGAIDFSTGLSTLTDTLSNLANTAINYQAAQAAISATNAPTPAPAPAPSIMSPSTGTIMGLSIPMILLLGAGAYFFMKKKRSA